MLAHYCPFRQKACHTVHFWPVNQLLYLLGASLSMDESPSIWSQQRAGLEVEVQGHMALACSPFGNLA